jgi:transposase
MTKPASGDKRRVAVRQFLIDKTPIKDVAVIHEVSDECIRKWVKWYKRTGEYAGMRSLGRQQWRHRYKMSAAAMNCLRLVLEEDPGLYWDEVQWHIWARTQERISRSTVARTGQEMGFKDKVAGTHSILRDRNKMELHARQREMYDSRSLIFVDEAHKRGRDLNRKRAKGRHGQQPYVPMTPHLAKNWTLLAGECISSAMGTLGSELTPCWP